MQSPVIRITVISAAVNLVFSALKIIAGILGKSQGLLADGLHSLSDLLSDVVVYFGIKLGNKPRDVTHYYGHKKIENITEIILGFTLMLSALYIGYDSGVRIYRQTTNRPEVITMVIAALSIIVKEYLYRVTVTIGKREKNSVIIANAWHHRSDSFSSIAVLAGIIVARFHPPLRVIDSYMGVIVSFIIIKVGWGILFKSTEKLIDTAPSPKIQRQIFTIVECNREVREYHNVRMRYVGNEIFIEMHILLDSGYSLEKAHDIATKVKQDLLKHIPNIYDVTIHMEPYTG